MLLGDVLLERGDEVVFADPSFTVYDDVCRRHGAAAVTVPTVDFAHDLGAMVAVELVKNGDAHQPDPDLTKALVQRAAAKGVVLLSCGLYGNVIRFLVPLTASDEIINEGLGLVLEALRELTAGTVVKKAANA
jgi:4-aminobutyrate aminotransferase-like enzyme